VLTKPADFDPAKKCALLCIIHGGPTGVDRPTMIDTRIYPADEWAARGALILKVNYRGSAGWTEMVVYKGFGHGISKPKAMRAAMQHNLAWFNHYIFGDPLPDFTDPELPEDKK
jgi:dipeptidyl aminopeptidase/acylaminoacyl peptidase